VHPKLEVVLVPVSDVDRSIAFYRDQVGFHLDVDWSPNPRYRVVQLTPTGSDAVSIQFGVGLTDAVPGALRGTYLVVDDLEAATMFLRGNGVEVSSPRHKDMSSGEWEGAYAEGIDEGHADRASFANFSDPDGNTWTLQEVGYGGA
jgi:catechol 2,3-dioxygenase-like lactoylglutathione lyase family enzyme